MRSTILEQCLAIFLQHNHSVAWHHQQHSVSAMPGHDVLYLQVTGAKTIWGEAGNRRAGGIKEFEAVSLRFGGTNITSVVIFQHSEATKDLMCDVLQANVQHLKKAVAQIATEVQCPDRCVLQFHVLACNIRLRKFLMTNLVTPYPQRLVNLHLTRASTCPLHVPIWPTLQLRQTGAT